MNLISVNPLKIFIANQNIVYKIVAVFLSAFFNQFNELSSANNVNTGRNSIGLCHHRFFVKFFNSAVLIHLHTAKSCGIISVHIGAYHSNVCSLGNVIFQNFVVIQLVHAISGCDDNIRFMTVFQKIQILINSICSPLIPEAIVRCNSRSKGVKSPLLSSKVPPFGRT